MRIKIPGSLKLRGEKGRALVLCLLNIEQNVSKAWEGGLILRHYTKHGIEHSENIITYLGKILKTHANLLNTYERFVLLASAYLHDIGMQFPAYAGLPRKAENEYTDEELEKIRENHHIASAAIIEDSVSQNPPEELVELGLRSESEDCKHFATFIAKVSKYHRKLNIEDEELKETSILGECMRLRLLAALLRLADTLDRTYKRVNMTRLKLVDIPVRSKFIWWGHWYCQSVNVENGKVKLYFRFPEEYRDTEIERVFKDRWKRAIEDDYNTVYDVLFKNNIKLYKEIIIEEPEYDKSIENLPGDVEEYIRKEIWDMQEKSQRVTEKTGVYFYVDGTPYSEEDDVKRCIANLLKYAEEENWKNCVQIIKDCEVLTMSPLDRMSLYLNSGNVFSVLGRLNDAKNYYENALKITEKERIREIYKDEAIYIKGATLGNIGLIYSAKGELDEALKYLQEALKIHREIGYRQGEANQLGNIGLIYSAKGELDEALNYLQEALEIHREIGYRQGEASDLGNIGLIYSDKGELDEALNYLQEALEIHREIGYRQGEASDLGNIGLIYSDKGELDEALNYHKEALEIDREIGYRQGEASDLGNIGLIYRDKGELDEALNYLQEALKIFMEINSLSLVIQALINIASIHFEKGFPVDGFKYLGMAISGAPSPDERNKAFSAFLGTLKNLIAHNEWEKIEAINVMYSTRILKVEDENVVNFLKALREYALWMRTSESEHERNYKEIIQGLSEDFRTFLKDLIEEG